MVAMEEKDEISGAFHIVEPSVSIHLFRRPGLAFHFAVLPGLYQPDEWTALTLDAATAALNQFPMIRSVLDIGSGCGVLTIALAQAFPQRGLRFNCCDMKPDAERNLRLNADLFAQPADPPGFRRMNIRDSTRLSPDDGAPQLVLANVPQLPAPSHTKGQDESDPDDYHKVSLEDAEDPVHGFGLGLLLDIGERLRIEHDGRFCMAFCRSSRVPAQIFDVFLQRLNASVLRLGPATSVLDQSTPFPEMAAAESRFCVQGAYSWQGKTVPASALAERPEIGGDVRIELRSCLIEIG